jgi:cytochrome bd-type quinol oxidase subunit 2
MRASLRSSYWHTEKQSGIDKTMRQLSKAIAWLCLLLTLGSAAAVVVHHHEEGAESGTCMVCVAAHTASPAAQIALPIANFIALSTVAIARTAATKQRLAMFALTVRPPPQPFA